MGTADQKETSRTVMLNSNQHNFFTEQKRQCRQIRALTKRQNDIISNYRYTKLGLL